MENLYDKAKAGTSFKGYMVPDPGMGSYPVDFLHDWMNYPDGEAEGDIPREACGDSFVEELRTGEWSTKLNKKGNSSVGRYYLMCLNENGVDKVYLGENDTEVDDCNDAVLFSKEEAEAKKKELASKGEDYWDVVLN